MKGYRRYRLDDYFSVDAPEKCCLFCKYCSDVFYDYSHGPYMFFCQEGHGGDFETCNNFEEEKDDV